MNLVGATVLVARGCGAERYTGDRGGRPYEITAIQDSKTLADGV